MMMAVALCRFFVILGSRERWIIVVPHHNQRNQRKRGIFNDQSDHNP
jgi:hypothetical protein